MKLSNEDVYAKFVHSDDNRCDVCFKEGRECMIIKFSWFSKKKICSSCISKLLRSCKKGVK